jgi:hypothetical protein
VYDAIKRENQQAAKLSPRDVSDIVDRDAERKASQKRPSAGEGGTFEVKSPGAVEDRSQDKRSVDGEKSDDAPRSRDNDRSQ